MKKIILLSALVAIAILPSNTLLSQEAYSPGSEMPKQTEANGIDLEKEKAAIRKVISNETETYYKQDFDGWKANFVNADYFRQYGYWEGYSEKVKYFNGFDTLQKVKQLQFKENRTYWKGSYEKRYNESFRIYADVAWYTFEQDSFESGTNKFLGKSVELRILEKQNGQWKIAYLGFHYLPQSRTY